MPCASDLSRIQSSHSRKETANSYGGRAILQGTRLGPTETLKIMKNKAGWLISLIGLRKATNISEAHFWVCLWGNFWRMLTEVGTPRPCAGRGFRLTQKEKVNGAPAPIPSCFWLWLWWDRLPPAPVTWPPFRGKLSPPRPLVQTDHPCWRDFW